MISDRPVFNFEYYKRSADYIREQIGDFHPEIGIILGTGLGGVADLIDAKCVIPYDQIPNFLVSKAPGHAGNLIIGTFEGRNVICMQGRFHSYDGYHFEQLSIPIRVMKLLETEKVIISNASGAVNTEYRPGDLMVIKDHIKLNGSSPMRGPNVNEFGPRFFDSSDIYTASLRKIALEVGNDSELNVHEGIYFFYPGPQFETPAEIRAERILGADVTGMSTVPEALAAAQCGMPCIGLSLVSNMAAGVLDAPLSASDVEETAAKVAPLLLDYFKELIRRLP